MIKLRQMGKSETVLMYTLVKKYVWIGYKASLEGSLEGGERRVVSCMVGGHGDLAALLHELGGSLTRNSLGVTLWR